MGIDDLRTGPLRTVQDVRRNLGSISEYFEVYRLSGGGYGSSPLLWACRSNCIVLSVDGNKGRPWRLLADEYFGV